MNRLTSLILLIASSSLAISGQPLAYAQSVAVPVSACSWETLASWNIYKEPGSLDWSDRDLETVCETFRLLPEAYRAMPQSLFLNKVVFKPSREGTVAEIGGPLARHRVLSILPERESASWLGTGLEGAYYEFVKQSLVHELTHAMDWERHLSESARWQQLSGWREKRLFGHVTSSSSVNQSRLNFARKYGMTNSQEDLATFAEEFFLPPPIEKDVGKVLKCRAPLKYEFFKKEFPQFTSIVDSVQCPKVEEWVDPAKVEAIEILFAGQSSRHLESSAGHLLLRIKYRSKDSNLENPDDLVMEFAANIPEKTPQTELYTGGLAGKFPTEISETKLGLLITEYTVLDDRDVWRYHVKLTREQIRGVVERLFEIKHNYQTKYRFFTDNCASLMVQQMAVGADQTSWYPEGGVTSPAMLLSHLEREGAIEPVSPSFYSLSRRAAIAQSEIARLGEAFVPAETLASFTEKLGTDHTTAYDQLLEIARAHPANAETVYQMLILSLELERWHDFHEFKDTARVSPQYQHLRTKIYEVRKLPGFAKATTLENLSDASDYHQINREHELLSRSTGSAFTGVDLYAISPAYTIVNQQGHLELEYTSNYIQENFGDPIRNSTSPGLATVILNSRVAISLEKGISIPRADTRLFDLSMFGHASPTTGGESRVKSVFEDVTGGLGLELSLLEFHRDRWRSIQWESDWITPSVILNLTSSAGFKDYLQLLAGVQLGSIWQGEDRGPSYNFVGAPLTLRGQVSLDQARNTQLRASVNYIPRLSQSGFHDEGSVQAELSQHVVTRRSFDLRANAAGEYWKDKTLRFRLGFQVRH